jgi:hypothetical protein
VPDYDLNDLLAALNEVAADSGHDDDDPSDDDDDWSREQGEDNEQDDGDDNDQGDYGSSPTVMRLRRLQADARTFKLPRGIAATKRPQKPVSKVQQNWQKISALRQKTSQINYEMKTGKLLAEETRKYQEASVALYLANLTPEQRREHDEDMRRMGHYYSEMCPEASPDWRKDSTAAFGAHYAPVARRTGKEA